MASAKTSVTGDNAKFAYRVSAVCEAWRARGDCVVACSLGEVCYREWRWKRLQPFLTDDYSWVYGDSA